MAASPGNIVSYSRVGVNRHTGKLIYGWDHCLQSINVIVTTALNTRIMRLDFGSDIPNMIDRPQNATTIIGWYSAIDAAIRKWEPGYRITMFSIDAAGPSGGATVTLDGIFYPRGHLGDYSISERRSAAVALIPSAT